MYNKHRLFTISIIVIAVILIMTLAMLGMGNQEHHEHSDPFATTGSSEVSTDPTVDPSDGASKPTDPSESTPNSSEPASPTEPADPVEHEHSYEDVVTKATCTEQGYTSHVCSACGEHYEDSHVEALGHSYGDWVIVKESTAESEGLKERSCTRCGEKESEVVPKVEQHEHKYSSMVVDPTCENVGYTFYTCDCGDTYQDNTVAEKGHSWSEWTVTKEPTDTEAGSKSRTCNVCGTTESELIEVHVHTYTDKKVAPTCDEAGYTVHTCSCGHSYTSDGVDYLGHEWSEWVVTVEPTVSSTGERSRSCSRCKEVVTELVPKLDAETGEAYESYIDPRITVKEYRVTTSYRYSDYGVTDYRTWGASPSIWINEDGTWTVAYINQDGSRVEFILETPPAGYISEARILEDGSYTVNLTGGYNN